MGFSYRFYERRGGPCLPWKQGRREGGGRREEKGGEEKRGEEPFIGILDEEEEEEQSRNHDSIYREISKKRSKNSYI